MTTAPVTATPADVAPARPADHPDNVTALTGMAAIPVAQVRPSPNNIRENLTGIDELALSIRENGLIQPLVVQRIPGEPGFQIVAGHRRYAAILRLDWPKVPCIIRRDMLPDEELLAMLVENGQRAGLDPIEEARALKRLKATGLSDAEVGRKVGRNQAYVSNRLVLLALPVEEQEQLRAGGITVGAATEAARIESGRTRPGAKGKKSSQHFSLHHALGTRARARCQRLGHKAKGAASVGGIACGECWESVVRADERQHLHDVSAAQDKCVLCGVEHDPDGGDA
ncbi:ParB/RepB/Spo0J family partition protein [Nocardioides sp. TRM66260-LWL]|uniref:ParB/RepB/Spo0J family partition protein n=1 Tax=Nocardioides sp. TRM66260-LWL TaxID=2874478 RepID=UPI001CC6A979|nr:ParB/RepB/Spo0J family partition protein [Nocardioides sp. TRM66260-LWL]MBZ5736465.1 ParB/RepB/Spo0J family partition protein [Nocardioides sp. TRM66260-LWL]